MSETRNTPQRKIILSSLMQMHCHPTADQVYAYIHARHPKISRATIYRNLSLLAEQNLIQKVPIPKGADCFDFQPHPHYHVQCEHCGRIFDLSLPYFERLEQQVADKQGFILHKHHILFEGICPDCQK